MCGRLGPSEFRSWDPKVCPDDVSVLKLSPYDAARLGGKVSVELFCTLLAAEKLMSLTLALLDISSNDALCCIAEYPVFPWAAGAGAGVKIFTPPGDDPTELGVTRAGGRRGTAEVAPVLKVSTYARTPDSLCRALYLLVTGCCTSACILVRGTGALATDPTEDSLILSPNALTDAESLPEIVPVPAYAGG